MSDYIANLLAGKGRDSRGRTDPIAHLNTITHAPAAPHAAGPGLFARVKDAITSGVAKPNTAKPGAPSASHSHPSGGHR